MRLCAARVMCLGKSTMSIPFRIILYVFMGSDAVNGGLKHDTKYLKQKFGFEVKLSVSLLNYISAVKQLIIKCNHTIRHTVI
jgi:hypothetical protein